MNEFPIYTYKGVLEENFPFKISVREGAVVNTILHAHEHLQLCYVMTGSCLHYTVGKEFNLTKGDLLSIPPGLEHRLSNREEWPIQLIQIDFMPHCISENMKDLSLMHTFMDFAYIQPFISEENVLPKLHFAGHKQIQIEGLIGTLLTEWADQEENFQLAIKAELLKLLVMIGREYTRYKEGSGEKQKIAYHHEAFYEAIRYIDKHYDEDLRLEELAALSHMAPSSFSTMLKMVTGTSYIEYVTILRLNSAADLLRTTDLNVTEISLRTGYNHLGHFTKMFKRHTGLTPGEYRKLQNTFTPPN
ncbi:hypothetical protein SY83_00485 [Paenibacillus swuensis]|uniref:HTH araC/xylS-type domain-containing protein n=2 Tax=Paenibacillus swuensis TaxID=1178515 RepID=A0A172TDU9_9BACL|nr:hypothetical protein SY83_00485 [Paenibacillus swuensis]